MKTHGFLISLWLMLGSKYPNMVQTVPYDAAVNNFPVFCVLHPLAANYGPIFALFHTLGLFGLEF